LATQGTQADQTQKRSLRNLDESLRNMFQSGSVKLGARGAGDSSAGRQLSYALKKLGTQSRTDLSTNYANIKNSIAGRATNLQNVYNQEKNKIQGTLDQNILSIQKWFGEQQQALQQAQVEGRLQKGLDLVEISKEILNNALKAAQEAKDGLADKQNALDSWAMSHSDNLQELQANLSAVSDDPGYNQNIFKGINVPTTTNRSPNQTYQPGGSTVTDDEDKNRGILENSINWGGI